ncbi:hypothetical protein B0I72DRAFT_142156 [Yarrowia lipolytica]|uniref:Secreted protein n=1 Tax=Yarrowia lipolytica TaxID=4952 RepID=A0A371C4D9_YARLL|nr:hypothetical protein B0I71DRAFT_133621 [Yarrowia lipolytica]RDW30071.1 hypothetical protein B0I72DRAFT_142156 [Yarrowia lipolytica]RDW38262.1 hypothetical protein B0I73DRAFT_134047 [Yarrowia lipolytica]RDW47193.1 hypothetical protein B0I74DRAFT_135664 [Yarrowia lipolytica]RDW53286.1 hypothetical protein B0I75DRAFT_136545 [Yarrowia lipolytica]
MCVCVCVCVCASVAQSERVSSDAAVLSCETCDTCSLIFLNGVSQSLFLGLLAHELLIHTSDLMSRVEVLCYVRVARGAASAQIAVVRCVVGKEN